MRAPWLVLALAACEPDVAPGAYLCGPEELCPDGLACDAATAVCELPNNADPFACGTNYTDVPADDAPASAQVLGDFACVSLLREARGCLPNGDTADYYELTVAEGCQRSKLTASVAYPLAFQRLVLTLAREGEQPVTIDTQCMNRGGDEATAVSCLEASVTAGTYAIGVVPDGTGNCDGACSYSRYSLAVQVSN